jgi:CheY-like chemotaxis protein
VLLVEDEETVREVTRETLALHGYRVLVGADGADALRLAAEHSGPIDLLLTDVVMPKMGGRDLAERLTALRPGIRTLYVSGYTDDRVIRTGALGTETALLQKPFTGAALARKVREVLDRR